MRINEQTNALAAKAARGVIWTGGGQVLRQVVQICTQLILVRLLVPEDFGLLGMAVVFVGIGQLLADFGIGSAIVQARSSDRIVLSSCFWLNVAVAVVLAAAVLAAAPLIGRFYGRGDLIPLIAVLSLNLLLSGLQVVPIALLYRDMRFSELVRAQVLGSVAGAVVAIALAWVGAGVWALVVQPLFGTSVNLCLTWLSTRWLPRAEFSFREIASLVRFSASLLGTNLIGYANRNVDALLIGRVLGAVPLAQYSMALQLMLYPLRQISSVIVRVLFPTLARIQEDMPRLRFAYLKAVSTIALITFPLMGGLFAVADDFVLVVLGAAWVDMAPVLKVLCWVGMMQSVGTTVGVIYLATGRTDVALRVTIVAFPFLTAGIAGGLPWGIRGVAIGYALVSCLLFYYTVLTAFRLIDLTLSAFHAAVLRPALAMLVMVLVLLAVGPVLTSWPATYRLAAGVGLGASVYCIASLSINRTQLSELVRIVLTLRRS